MILTGQKINLRYPTLDDVDSITHFANDEAISKFTFVPYPYCQQDAIDFIELADNERKNETGLHFGIELKETKKIIGMIGLNIINHVHLRTEVGYWVARNFWGQGIALEALNLMVEHCFYDKNLERVYAFVRPDNVASWKLLEKAGFEREGLLKKLMKKDGVRYDHYIYGKVKG